MMTQVVMLEKHAGIGFEEMPENAFLKSLRQDVGYCDLFAERHIYIL